MLFLSVYVTLVIGKLYLIPNSPFYKYRFGDPISFKDVIRVLNWDGKPGVLILFESEVKQSTRYSHRIVNPEVCLRNLLTLVIEVVVKMFWTEKNFLVGKEIYLWFRCYQYQSFLLDTFRSKHMRSICHNSPGLDYNPLNLLNIDYIEFGHEEFESTRIRW